MISALHRTLSHSGFTFIQTSKTENVYPGGHWQPFQTFPRIFPFPHTLGSHVKLSSGMGTMTPSSFHRHSVQIGNIMQWSYIEALQFPRCGKTCPAPEPVLGSVKGGWHLPGWWEGSNWTGCSLRRRGNEEPVYNLNLVTLDPNSEEESLHT